MTIARKSLGRAGEALAAAFLSARGLTIVERNFRCKIGEIDLIAREGRTLVFVEVKTRRGRAFGLPQEAVGREKQEKIRQVASFYLAVHGRRETACRFDVVAITEPLPGQAEIEWIKNAF